MVPNYVHMEIGQRHPLRKKEAKKYIHELESTLVCTIPPVLVEIGKSSPYNLLLFNGQPYALLIDGHPFLNLRGMMKYKPQKKWLSVDMGAVPYVTKGADVMAPGITDADRDIRTGDLVWIKDEKNGQPLAIGEAVMDGEEMVVSRKGKAVKILHHVNDEIWKIGESL